MTPKEKAKQLIDKYIDMMPIPHHQTECDRLKHVKDSLWFIIDDIMYEISRGLYCDWIKERSDCDNTIIYWRSVRDEVEKI